MIWLQSNNMSNQRKTSMAFSPWEDNITSKRKRVTVDVPVVNTIHPVLCPL